MIVEFELAKSEHKIKESDLFLSKTRENLLVFRQRHWWLAASTTRGWSQSDSSLSFPIVPFLAGAITVLVSSCCLFYLFTIHRMLCMCYIHVFPIDYALKNILPCWQGWISLVTVCSSGASSIFLCFCHRTFLLSSWGNTFSVALYLLQ